MGLNDLTEVFPEYSNELRGVVNRLKDLMIPFQQKWYYTPEMRGSYSIKYVLPALVPELSYDGLPIKEGATASLLLCLILLKVELSILLINLFIFSIIFISFVSEIFYILNQFFVVSIISSSLPFIYSNSFFTKL